MLFYFINAKEHDGIERTLGYCLYILFRSTQRKLTKTNEILCSFT